MNLQNKIRGMAIVALFVGFLFSTSCGKKAEEKESAEHPTADSAAQEHPKADSVQEHPTETDTAKSE